MSSRKNNKFNFYLQGAVRSAIPSRFFQKKLPLLLSKGLSDAALRQRVAYYNQVDFSELPAGAKTISEFKKEKKSTYFFDLLKYLKYFDQSFRISYLFGDVTHVPAVPTIVKSRPIDGNNRNSILMKLNSTRHFVFLNDTTRFEEKENRLAWRGTCYSPRRKAFIRSFYNKDFCDVGQTNTKGDLTVPWQKRRLSLKQQLRYKFILAIEGNDVASNLKWAMSSNSLVFMTKPIYETWFMEGTLKPDHHYVLLHDDYSNTEEKIKYYSQHTSKARQIIHNAHEHVAMFKNGANEDMISLLVLQKYFDASHQIARCA